MNKNIENLNAVNLTSESHESQIDNEMNVIPVIHEEVVFDKRVVETGKVRISKYIREFEEVVDEPLFREEVAVERVPINQFVEARPAVRQEGDTMIIPVVQEQIFVEKRLVLVEELHVRKQVVEAHQPQRVILRKEEVDIKRTAENDNVGR
jgi:uncharacterized protein (TIGR02271 family)